MYFTRHDIEQGLAQLVAELSSLNRLITIQVVGGAAITLHADRGILTNDVDALFVTDSPVQAAIERVAASRKWPMDWANNNVLLFVSHFDQPSDWEARFTSGEARILIARPPLLLMPFLSVQRPCHVGECCGPVQRMPHSVVGGLGMHVCCAPQKCHTCPPCAPSTPGRKTP